MRKDLSGSAGGAVLAILACTLLLTWPVAINGYPLMFPDTGTYLSHAIGREGVLDRPPYYSLFLLPLHATLTVWPVPFAQAAIVSIIVIRFLQLEFPGLGLWRSVLVVAVTALGSGASIHASKLMPDIFVPLILMMVWMYCVHFDRLGRAEVFLGFGLMVIMLASHTASPLLSVGLAVVALFILAFRIGVLGVLKHWRGGAFIVLAAVLAIAAQSLYGYLVIGRPTPAPAGSFFMLARLIHDGPGRLYLEQNCPSRHWALCSHLDSLGAEHNELLWDSDSAFAKITRERGEVAAFAEAGEIARGTIWAYPLPVATAVLKNTIRQFFNFTSIDTYCPCNKGKLLRVMETYFPQELPLFLSARQNTGAWPPTWMVNLHLAVAVISAILLVLCCLGIRGRRYRSLAGYLLLGLMMNAAIMGGLSGPDPRYQARIVWLVTLLAVGASLHRAAGRDPAA